MIAALLLARVALGAVFAVAAFAKLADQVEFKKTIGEFGLPDWTKAPLALLIPIAELVLIAALLPTATAAWGAGGLLAMLVAFCAGIGWNLAQGRRPDCHCFGQLSSGPIGWKTLVRNFVLSAVAAFIMIESPSHPEASMIAWLGNLNGVGAAILALAVISVIQFWMLVHVLRQNGRLMLRVEVLEEKLGIQPAPPPPAGLPVDSDPPQFRLAALNGGTVTLDMFETEGKSLLLAFSEPDCTLCDKLLPELAQWQQEHSEHVNIIVISRGTREANQAKVASHDLRNVLLQRDREVAKAYKATGSPSAVLIRNGRIASPLGEGLDAIRALVRQAILPPPVKTGEKAPALRLADLRGNTVDLSKLGGQRTLLLFWNPSCGFCQQMLPDVKKWERDPGRDAPQLLVISAGSLQDNREQGFRSTVLLDPGFAALHVFSAAGTPSAVMLDEEGTVVSNVAVGADEVWALAKSPGAVAAGSR